MRSVSLLTALAFFSAALVGLGSPAQAYDASWDHNDAAWYAWTGVYERYVFGGSKWRDNNRWDSDEGTDCSGFAAKAWAVPNYTSTMTTYHPYSTANFYFGFPYGVFRTRTVGWYATVWVYRASQGGPSDHMGLFHSRNSDGTWTTYEAKGSAYGVVINRRSLSTLISWNYRRLARKNWV
jgi:hypothetical protein